MTEGLILLVVCGTICIAIIAMVVVTILLDKE